MKKAFFTALMLVGVSLSASAQHDDLYFVPKKKAKTESAQTAVAEDKATPVGEKTLSVNTVSTKGLEIDEDTYNRRGSYVTDQGDAVSEFAMSDEGFVLITEEGDTMWLNTDTLRLTRVTEDDGWVNGFNGSYSDYEYAMRLIRFRNPHHAIPVGSMSYWDVVHGVGLWPGREYWNIYDDGLYAYIFPTSSNNFYYWDYMAGVPWGRFGAYSLRMDGWTCYGGVWYDPWFNAYFPGGFGGYYAGWLPGWHHGYYPIHHPGGYPGWGGGGKLAIRNDRHNEIASTRRGAQDNGGVSRTATSTAASRQGTSATRGESGANRSSSVRVVTGRPSAISTDRVSGSAVRTPAGRSAGNEEVVRRSSSTPSSVVSRGTATAGSSRDSYARQSSSRSNNSSSAYNRPSSTRGSSSSAVSRSSSQSSSGLGSGSSSSSSSRSSSRSSSYSSSSSSYSSSSYSSGSSSSYSSGGGSYSSGSRGGGSYGGGSRSGGSSSGSRR
ncbi:MAG: hypothetical protein IKY64_02250 [Bacteroidaceae bacterium]|nr:hypothetical protein [Bacteroidaceae bacterium]